MMDSKWSFDYFSAISGVMLLGLHTGAHSTTWGIKRAFKGTELKPNLPV